MKTLFMRFLATLLLPVFCYTTTVKEIHYLFLHHSEAHHDECENHLHAAEDFENCSFCKINLAVADEPESATYLNFTTALLVQYVHTYVSPLVNSSTVTYSLRGPPIS